MAPDRGVAPDSQENAVLPKLGDASGQVERHVVLDMSERMQFSTCQSNGQAKKAQAPSGLTAASSAGRLDATVRQDVGHAVTKMPPTKYLATTTYGSTEKTHGAFSDRSSTPQAAAYSMQGTLSSHAFGVYAPCPCSVDQCSLDVCREHNLCADWFRGPRV
jgi:hypothetical protein